MSEHVDVLIVGAGISGVGIARHLAEKRPGTTYAILERRANIGGTWDLFRYPGIRSDSDMYSFAYRFRPWRDTRILADGHRIRRYVEEAADEYGVREHVRFGRKVTTASWSSADERWHVTALDEATGTTEQWTAQFLLGCTGYYDYDSGYRPAFPDEDRFTGTIVHPQFWPEGLATTGKRIVIIGSGATAITLVPALAERAAHVTMLQRTPTYVVALPAVDPVAAAMYRARVPASVVYRLGRARNIAIQRRFYQLTRRRPAIARRMVLDLVRTQTRGKVDMKHFTPDYDPWDQRLCVAPNGDLFTALRSGRASVVTDHIERFTESGVQLRSGEHLEADIIVTATGLNMQMLGGVAVDVDGTPVTTHDRVLYKGLMLEGVPNHMVTLGYTNASWTLKVELNAEWFCRLLDHRDAEQWTQVVAEAGAADRGTDSILGSALTSGYIRRAEAIMPRQGTRGPWKVANDYVQDAATLRRSPIADGVLRFSQSSRPVVATTA